jgi:hypothetical protein
MPFTQNCGIYSHDRVWNLRTQHMIDGFSFETAFTLLQLGIPAV